MKRISGIAVFIILLLALSYGGYRTFSHPQAKQAEGLSALVTAGANNEAAAVLKPQRTPPEGQKEYYDAAYRFSLFYPADLSVKTYDEGGGATTFTFQNTQTGQGFEIYVLPYEQTQVSAERFKEDEPSGVRNSPQNVMIDGTQAVSFYGSDAALGDTAEVWFIHGGYLFEVTTLKPLAGWLAPIMQSWEFL